MDQPDFNGVLLLVVSRDSRSVVKLDGSQTPVCLKAERGRMTITFQYLFQFCWNDNLVYWRHSSLYKVCFLPGLVLNVPVEEAYCGLWGYNSFLTTAALGGLFVVPGLQTTVAALFAGIFSTILQYVLTPLFAKVKVDRCDSSPIASCL